MDARSIIAQVRDRIPLDGHAAEWFARGLASGEVTDAQAGAFAMAVLLNGLGEAGRVALASAMRDSGKLLEWQLPGPVIDKHSTGGIGDCTSLLLAPALAACGAYVPMISGRGLGHTGGTLDKLEAIPGYRADVPVEELYALVADIGCAIVGATADIAPADRRLYAIRDVTSTVESIDLITASILSKKLAAGLEALVLDVKVGTGAFMKSGAEAEALAKSLVRTANDAGCRTMALITDMNQPLAASAGNALEVMEALATLTGDEINQRLWDVTIALGAEALVLADLAESARDGADQLGEALRSGRAFASPVTLLVHDGAGLMVSYRGAIALPGRVDLPAPPAASPCDGCAAKPCLSACPARALDVRGYDVPACHAFLDMADGADCLSGGCIVRRACPISHAYGRLPEQSAYHMRLFHP